MPLKGYIILSELSQEAVNSAIKYGDIFSVDPRKLGVYIGEDENVYPLTVRRTKMPKTKAAPFYGKKETPFYGKKKPAVSKTKKTKKK